MVCSCVLEKGMDESTNIQALSHEPKFMFVLYV